MTSLRHIKKEIHKCGPYIRGCIQKLPDLVDNEICTYKNKHLLRSNTKDYGGKTH
jgi:hypothetical protein